MSKIGKRVVDDLYVHLSALDYLEDLEQRGRIEAALGHLSPPTQQTPSVAKLNLRTGRLSLLAYRDFDEDPFPELAAGWVFSAGTTSAPSYRIYADSLNWAAAGSKDTLLRWKMESEMQYGNETEVQPGVQA